METSKFIHTLQCNTDDVDRQTLGTAKWLVPCKSGHSTLEWPTVTMVILNFLLLKFYNVQTDAKKGVTEWIEQSIIQTSSKNHLSISTVILIARKKLKMANVTTSITIWLQPTHTVQCPTSTNSSVHSVGCLTVDEIGKTCINPVIVHTNIR